LLAEVELARGDSTAAAEALDETAERGQGEVVLARAAVGLARRAPAEAVAGELAAWLKRAREPALVLRGHELLGRALVLQELEGLGSRAQLPTFAGAREAFGRAIDLGGKPGGGDARLAQAQALLELAACEDVAAQGRSSESAARRARASAVAPFSVAV